MGVIARYREFLPVGPSTPEVDLQEGSTPLVPSRNIGRALGLSRLFFKYEGLNPTGSFKDRGMVVAVAKALEAGSRVLMCASTGNTSASMAAYAARMGVRAIVVRSFARIHETNLKKQGMLALTFANKEDYDKVMEDDSIDITGLKAFAPGLPLTMVLNHGDGSKDLVTLNHTYNEPQIEWFTAGGALNVIRAAVVK